MDTFSRDNLPQDIRLVMNLQTLIENNYKTNRDPGFYSQLLNISLKRLNRLVALYLGSTVYQLLQDRVHVEVICLLKFSTLSVKQISFELGVCDPSYFSRCFKKITGMRPLKFRKMYRDLSFFKGAEGAQVRLVPL